MGQALFSGPEFNCHGAAYIYAIKLSYPHGGPTKLPFGSDSRPALSSQSSWLSPDQLPCRNAAVQMQSLAISLAHALILVINAAKGI